MPAMRHVDSSSVEAIGYELSTRTLYVRFLTSGATYIYHEVDEMTFHRFLRADSKGRFLNLHIRDKYEYARL